MSLIKEIYTTKEKSTVLSVTNNAITAVKKSDTSKTGLRVYDGEFIGVAGTLGAYDENALYARAKDMLNYKIPYACAPAQGIVRTDDLSGSFELSDIEFYEKSSALLDKLAKEYPKFAFNHQITYKETEELLKNDKGTELVSKDKDVQVVLMYKHKDSISLMDGMGLSVSRGFDFDDVYRLMTETLEAYDEKIELPEEKMPVLFLSNHHTALMKFYSDLNVRTLGTGASLFAGKIGEKLFADNFTLQVNRNPKASYNAFFDAEGTVLKNDSFALIENGVLKSPYGAKKAAKMFGFEATGSASGAYDSVPDASPMSIHVAPGTKSIKELLGGRKAILCVSAAGGDFTAQGEFATPIQTAYVFDGEKLLGRLPQLSARSTVFDMFGKDFVGIANDGASAHNPFRYLALDMNISVIGEWM